MKKGKREKVIKSKKWGNEWTRKKQRRKGRALERDSQWCYLPTPSLLQHNYVGVPYCWAGIYNGCVACCSLVSHGEYANGTDRQTDRPMPDRYIKLSARCHQHNKCQILVHVRYVVSHPSDVCLVSSTPVKKNSPDILHGFHQLLFLLRRKPCKHSATNDHLNTQETPNNLLAHNRNTTIAGKLNTVSSLYVQLLWLGKIFHFLGSQSQWGICIMPLTIWDSSAEHVKTKKSMKKWSGAT